jgi:mannonate dehydratase
VELGGVPRCIFGTFDGYVRALEIANSPNVGVCFCCGCWLEGGPLMGKNVFEAIRHFGKQGMLFKVHLQAVSSPLPRFTEVFIDECYVDFYDVLKVLREVNFNGVVWPTHVPAMVDVGCTTLRRDGGIGGTAFYVGYVKALLKRVNAEAAASGRTA